MINSKFLKAQIKSSIWITIGIAFIPVIMSILSMSFTPYFRDTTDGTTSYVGAISLLGLTNLFGTGGEGIAIAFSVALSIKLINGEISKGYMSSWLSLPMSRITIFLTKILTIFLASLIILFPNLITEFIMVGAKRYPDFGGAEAWILIKLNLGLLLVFFFVSSVAVIFSILFNKTSHAITLSIVVPFIFIVLFILSYSIAEIDGLHFLQYFKYITVFSLFNFNQLLNEENLFFIWKFILLFVFGSGIFIGSAFLFKNKNLFI